MFLRRCGIPVPIPVTPGSAPLAPPASPGVLHPLTHCVTTGFSFPLPIGILVLALAVIAPILVAMHLERIRRSG